MNEETQITKNNQQERTSLENLLYYLSYLLRHKYLIVSLTLIAAIGSVAYSLVSLKLPPEKSYLPNFYRAYSVLIVGQGSGSDMATMLTSLGIQVPVRPEEMNYGELGTRVLRSRPFIDEIIEQHNMIKKYKIEEKTKTTSRNLFLTNSDIQYEARTGTLTIGYTDIDPEFARDVVESMVSNLQRWFQQWDGTSSQQQLAAMERKIEEVSAEIDRLEGEIQSFQSEYGVMSVDQIAQAQTTMITDLQTQLIQTEVAIKNYTGFSNIEDQELIQLRAQRESLRELISQIENGTMTGGIKMPSQDELPALAIEYSHLRMSHEIQMRIFQNLKEQYEVQKLTTSGISVFNVLEPAEVPEEKSGPTRSKLCLIVTFFGFFASITLALFSDLVRNIKNDPKKRRLLKGE